MLQYRKRARWSVVLFCTLMLAGLATWMAACTIGRSPVSGQKRAYGYSWEQEKKIGKQADAQTLAVYGLYKNEDLQEYVDQIGQKVLQNSDMRGPDVAQQFRETEFTFRVLDSPIVNAFALPGGYIYLTRGLLAHLQNEAQLAVVLGHEIAHVAARHASQRAFEMQLGKVGLIGGAILGQEVLGVPAQQVLNLGGTATQLLFLKYGRDDERESDRLGVEYAARAGYEAKEASGFFESLERLTEGQGEGLPTFLSTHPDPGNREQTILELAKEWAPKTEMTLVKQNEYFNHLEGVVIGEDPRNGYSLDGIFYHPGLKFRFDPPNDWQVVNQASQVQIIAPEQQAAILFQIAEEAQSAEEAVRSLLDQEGIGSLSAEATRVNGMPAYMLLAEAQQKNQTYRLLVYAIEYNNSVFQFTGYASAQAFSSFRSRFQETMESFDQLTDPERLNVEPVRLRISPANQTAPYRTFVPEQLPRDLDPQAMAILNQVELDELIEEGRPLKQAEM